mgnify:CR=1 FL=1
MTGVMVKKEFILIIGFICWFLSLVLLLLRRKTKITKKIVRKKILQLILIEYILMVIGLTLMPIRIPPIARDIPTCINLNVLDIFDYGLNRIAMINIFGNILLFAPLPILLHLNGIKNIKLLYITLLILFCSIGIEFLQYLETCFKFVYIARTVDILDIILNTLGAPIGYVVMKLYKINFD